MVAAQHVAPSLYPARQAPYKRDYVAADDHKHYLPGGLNTFMPAGNRCQRVRTAPSYFPIRRMRGRH